LLRLPKDIVPILRQAIADGRILSAEDKWLAYCLLFYRNCRPERLLLCDGMAGGLGYRILQAAQACDTPAAFFAALRSKKHTDAYLRRALLYGVFGVTRAQLNAPPAYTQILALNERGREVLAVSRKKAAIPVFNRPSAINALPWEEKASVRADSVYCALLERPSRPSDEFRYSPYRETAEKLSISSVGQTIDILEKI
jgi:predicted nucleotidyltransferase